MKKYNIVKIIKYSVLSIFSFAVFSACEIGLGEAVDLEAPVVELTSHKDNDSVAQTFRLSGKAHDNEEVTKLSVDFEEADIHFKIEPGKKWKKKINGTDWTEVSEDHAGCSYEHGEWIWFIDVNAAEAKSGMGSNYSLEIIVSDAMGNNGKESKINCSLIVDEKIPNVSIYKPDIVSSYTKVKDTFDSYNPDPDKGINGNNFLNLLNGEIILYGRQEGSASFRELRIELDDGTTDGCVISENVPVIKNPTTEIIASEYPLGNSNKYYSKTLTQSNESADLRNWSLSIQPQEWITDAHSELKSGKHIVRIITTSISNSDAWERKVVGYFIWWPQSDNPWVEANDGGIKKDEPAEIYPSANISGIAYDDDGILSLSYTFEKEADDGTFAIFEGINEKALNLSEEQAKTSAWSIKAPSEEGVYRLTIKIIDINGKTGKLERFFKTMDVQAPEISVSVNSSALINENGDIEFSGTASDDGKIQSLKVILLNPEYNDEPDNMIRYVGGKESFWNSADKATDSYNNKIFNIKCDFTKYDNTSKKNNYKFTKKLNLFTDLNIGLTKKSKLPLKNLNFVFRALDNGGTAYIHQVTLSGDSDAPELEITSIQQFDKDDNKKTDPLPFSGEVPNLEVKSDGDYVILKGTWYDNSVKSWNSDSSRIDDIQVKWGDAKFEKVKLTKISDGKYEWEYKGTEIPAKATPITVSLTDYGDNTTSVTKSLFIETTELSLERIGAYTNDGVYPAGKEIELFLEFTKNTQVEGSPELVLNVVGKDGKPRCAAFDSSSNGNAQLIFKYTVQAGDNVDKLDVESIDSTNVTWKAAVAGTQTTFTPSMPTDPKNKLKTSRNIKIDTNPPYVTKIESLSSGGYYKNPAKILLKLSFDDSVSIKNTTNENSNELNIGLGLKDITSPVIKAERSGSNIIFTYTVSAGENASPLKFKENSFAPLNISVKDDAGNEILAAGWKLNETELKDGDGNSIYIDNTPPDSPEVTAGWGDQTIVNANTYFEVTGSSVEYTIDDGTSWQSLPESKKVDLKNNGTYKIKARQYDEAGNESNPSVVKVVTVDKGDFIKNVTVVNAPGTYQIGSKITGKVNFRKEVTLPQDSAISLNVKRSGTYLPAIVLNECKNEDGKGSSFTFEYKVDANDVIDTENNENGYLKVRDWSFTDASIEYKDNAGNIENSGTVNVSFSKEFKAEKDIPQTKNIQIETTSPLYSNAVLSADNTTLTITFNKEISKISSAKEIILEMTESFKVPAVLKESQYNDLSASISGLDDYYTAGVNGAATSGEYLKPDTTTKYILNYGISDDDSNLVKKFKDANKNKVIVPLYSSNVRASGRSLIVTLSGVYAIPVKGATYKLTIPAGIVQDKQYKNPNSTKAEKTGIKASGVEPPYIRIQKNDQEITSSGSAQDATVTMPDTAEMKINCQTPDATITFAKKEEPSNQITIKDAKTHTATSGNPKLTSDDVKFPTSGLIDYSSATAAQKKLGTAINSYTDAKGLKIAIVAKAEKRINDTDYSESAYEYAARTVLKLDLDTRYYDRGGGYASVTTCEGEKRLYKLPVWIQGGDSPAGGNTIAGYPISWDDCSTFKLMVCDRKYYTHTFNNNQYQSTSGERTAATGKTAFSADGSWQNERTFWYWVTWDLSSVFYPGFVVGDVPNDASTYLDNKKSKKGPKNWYVGECSWNSIKQNTALYPGETLELSLHEVDDTDDNGNTKGAYLFRSKNHGSR